MSIGTPIPEIQHFQSLTLKIQGQGHSSRWQSRYKTLSTHIPFVPSQSALPFPEYSNFKIWCWKFKVEVISEVKVESRNVGPTFSPLTSLSFHVNRASHPWGTTFSIFDLENQGSRSYILSTHIPFAPCQSALPFLRYSILKIWPWKSRVKVKWPWCCATTGLDSSIELWMV